MSELGQWSLVLSSVSTAETLSREDVITLK